MVEEEVIIKNIWIQKEHTVFKNSKCYGTNVSHIAFAFKFFHTEYYFVIIGWVLNENFIFSCSKYKSHYHSIQRMQSTKTYFSLFLYAWDKLTSQGSISPTGLKMNFVNSWSVWELSFSSFFIIFLFYLISWRLITLQYCSGFCHTLTWISLGYTCIPHPDPPSQGTFIFNEASHSGSSSPSSLSLSSAARFSYYLAKMESKVPVGCLWVRLPAGEIYVLCTREAE